MLFVYKFSVLRVYGCVCALYVQAEGWISEKLTIASYHDPTNLQSKLQKHLAFEAELSANKGRVDSVTEVWSSLDYTDRFAGPS